MATPMTRAVYVYIIEDVMRKVREMFVEEEAEDVLPEIQTRWEMKLMHTGSIEGFPLPNPLAIDGGTTNASAPDLNVPAHDLNIPYEGIDEYETPTADMTPLQTPIQTPLPGTTEQSMYQTLTPREYPTASDTGKAIESSFGSPSPYMQPPSPGMNQRPLGVDVNVDLIEGQDVLERGGQNQQLSQQSFNMSPGKRKREDLAPHFDKSGYIPQQDVAGDGDNNDDEPPLNEDDDEPPLNEDDDELPLNEDDDEPPLNEDDDELPLNEDEDEPPLNEDDDDVNEGKEEPQTYDLVLSLFEKVTRSKNRWKCTLTCGSMHINDRDILFNKATGDFDF